MEIPVDFSQPNPNGLEYDNLYLVSGRFLMDRLYCHRILEGTVLNVLPKVSADFVLDNGFNSCMCISVCCVQDMNGIIHPCFHPRGQGARQPSEGH